MAYYGGPRIGSHRNSAREPSLADLVDNIRYNLEYAGMSPPLPPDVDRFRDPRFRPLARVQYRDGPCRDMPETGMAMFSRESQPFEAHLGMRSRILSRGSREYVDAENAYGQHTATRSDITDSFPVRMSDEVPPLPTELGFSHNIRDSFHSGGSGPRSRSTSFNCQSEGSRPQSRSTSFSSQPSARPFVPEDDLIARELATVYCHYGRGGSVTPSIASEDAYDFVERNFDEYDPDTEAWNIVNPG